MIPAKSIGYTRQSYWTNGAFGPRQGGITLIELMATLSIMALIVAASVYSFVTSGQNQLGPQLAANLANALRYARMQAIYSGNNVSVCPATNSALNTCSTSATAWNNGWIVFTDANGNGVIANNANILQVFPMTSRNPNMTATISGAFASYANFTTPYGITAANKQLNVSIKPTGCTGDYGRIVYLTAAGRIVITNTSCP